MSCVNPFVIGKQAFPCGKCLPCRFRQRRIWFHRLLLEGTQHDRSSFVTLTYDPVAEPEDGNVQPDHLRNWLKRFRKLRAERYPWQKVRYFAVAEYGDQSGKPHYHLLLFGVACELGGNRRDCQCLMCTDVRGTWGLGFITVDPLSPATIAYVCGYVTRKLLSPTPSGKRSPFTRMSNRPGIGATAMWDVASALMQYNRTGLPLNLGQGRKEFPLGRYLRSKLSEMTGLPVNNVASEQLQTVRDFASANSRSVSSVFYELGEVYQNYLQTKLDRQRGKL